MTGRRDTPQEYFRETLTQNVQRGDEYWVRFRDDATVYRGIPLMELKASGDDTFQFKILHPPCGGRVVTRRLADIESLEDAR